MHTQENRNKKKIFYYRGLSQPTAAPVSYHLAVQSVLWPKIPFWMQQNHQQFQKVSDKAPLPQQEWLEMTSANRENPCGRRCDVTGVCDAMWCLARVSVATVIFWYLTTPLQIQCPFWVVVTSVTGVVTSLVIDLSPWAANRSPHHWHSGCPSLLFACWLAFFY